MITIRNDNAYQSHLIDAEGIRIPTPIFCCIRKFLKALTLASFLRDCWVYKIRFSNWSFNFRQNLNNIGLLYMLNNQVRAAKPTPL